MHTIDATDPFYTPEVIADIRKSILMRISKDTDIHRLERIRDLLTHEPFAPVAMTEETMSVGEHEAAYYTRCDVESLRKRLLQHANSCELDMMEDIFSYYDHDGMTFKDAYLDAKSWNEKMFPQDVVKELANVNFMIDRDPESDDWHEPQTHEEWDALDRELDEEATVPHEEFLRVFANFLK